MTGGSWPVALWTTYMKAITADMPVEQFPEYDPTMSTWTPTATQTPTETATEEPTDEPTQDQATQVPQGLVGQNVAAARQAIRNAGLKPTVTKQYSDTVAPDVVMSVSPGEGSTVNQGTTVLVVISQGPEPKATTQVPGVSSGDPPTRPRRPSTVPASRRWWWSSPPTPSLRVSSSASTRARVPSSTRARPSRSSCRAVLTSQAAAAPSHDATRHGRAQRRAVRWWQGRRPGRRRRLSRAPGGGTAGFPIRRCLPVLWSVAVRPDPRGVRPGIRPASRARQTQTLLSRKDRDRKDHRRWVHTCVSTN
ncbi:hypothetical protein GCM10025864_14500 [Luteimicrobium album]|uniref:PASTA domain-containing protein n=1 Tax=Luteimicrobium album TaxID=1054550 RepID=A0ABQ6HZ05_9MICO|nr:hypothetical protein GCM10025864_14500 [Luteimicrobium album]